MGEINLHNFRRVALIQDHFLLRKYRFQLKILDAQKRIDKISDGKKPFRQYAGICRQNNCKNNSYSFVFDYLQTALEYSKGTGI